PLAREAAAFAASAARGCLRVRPLLDTAASVCGRHLMRLSPTRVRPNVCLGHR
ncbi:hypothetical protein B296_00019406, partial [Ensete ventricosum]